MNTCLMKYERCVAIMFLLLLSTSSAQSCGNVCFNNPKDAHDACWENGSHRNGCHVIRCNLAGQAVRGWSCSSTTIQDSSSGLVGPRRSATINRGCRNICRYQSKLAWDDCLFKNRTVSGCSVRRCEAPGISHQGWICSPTETTAPIQDTEVSGQQATCFTDPHCRSFDGLSFDCQAIGEFTLAKSKALGFEMQARFRGADTRGTVTKGIAIKAPKAPTVQLSMAFNKISGGTKIAGCPVLFYVNGQKKPLGSGTGSKLVQVTIDGLKLKVQYENGIRVESSVYESPNSGCYFEFMTLFVPDPIIKANSFTGLFGKPNKNPFDDWRSRTDVVIPPPKNYEESLFDRAYQYCTKNWCIRDKEDSLFTYEQGTTFRDFSKCDMPFGEPLHFEGASAELLSLCGTDPACLVDGMLGGVEDARAALGVQASIDEQTSALSPFRFDPAIVTVESPMNVRVTVDISKRPAKVKQGIKSFNVYKVNSHTGAVVKPFLVKLFDDGSEVHEDPFAGDGIFSNVLAIVSNTAGETLSYRAIPVFKDGERTSSPVAITAIDAIRSYSLASRLGAKGETETSMKIGSIAGLEMLVKYSWPQDQFDLDTSTMFLNHNVGFSCSSNNAYLSFGGDDTSGGGAETVIVKLDKAKLDKKWTKNTKILFRSGWYSSSSKGPATLRMILRDSNSKKEIQGTLLQTAITPGKNQNCASKKLGAILNIEFGSKEVHFKLERK